MNGKTKVIAFKVDEESYYVERLEDVKQGDFIACTMEHFVCEMMKLSEQVFPTIRQNPLWQSGINWNKIRIKIQENGTNNKDTD